MRVTLSLFFFISIILVCKGQKPIVDTYIINPHDTINTVDVVNMVKNKNLTFLYFVPVVDSFRVREYFSKEVINKSQAGIGHVFFYFIMTNKVSEDLIFDSVKLSTDNYFVFSNHLGLCNDLTTQIDSSDQVVLPEFSSIGFSNIYHIRIREGICTSNKLQLFASKIEEISNIYFSKYSTDVVSDNLVLKLPTVSENIIHEDNKTENNTEVIINYDSTIKNSYKNKNEFLINLSALSIFNNFSEMSDFVDYPIVSNNTNYAFSFFYNQIINSNKSNKHSAFFWGVGLEINGNNLSFELTTKSNDAKLKYGKYADVVEVIPNQKDLYGDNYDKIIYYSGLRESVSINFLNLYPQFQCGYNWYFGLNKNVELNVSGNFGLVISNILTSHYEAKEGKVTYAGYYIQYDTLRTFFDGVESMGFYNNQDIYKNEQELILKNKSFLGFSAGFNIGFYIYNYGILLGYNFQTYPNIINKLPECNVLSSEPNTYYSLLYQEDKLKFNSNNFKIGVSFKF